MKIRTKIALQFTLIVAVILGVFSISLFYLLRNNTKVEFHNYLKDRAVTTAQLLIKEKNIDNRLLKIVDRNTLSTLYAAEVLVFNDDNKVAYSNYEADTIYYSPELLIKVRKQRYLVTSYKNKEVVGLMYRSDVKDQEFLVLAQSEDRYGKEKLQNIKDAMTYGILTAIVISVIFGFIFAGYSLRPISRINNEVSKITSHNLIKKLSTGNNKDEIAQLARNFNLMLSRLEESFDLQRSFVSNASHELRTPLAAIKSEIQVALEKERGTEEYKEVLRSLYIDNQRLIQLTNGLLQLAKSEKGETTLLKKPTRIDDVLFETQEELLSQYSEYSVHIDFEAIPEDDNWVTVNGNKALIKTLFGNLYDNACKYSPAKRADVSIKFNKNQLYCGQ